MVSSKPVWAIIIFFLVSLFASIGSSQTTEPPSCPDKCEDSTLFLKGIWNEKLKECVYSYQKPCKYGCKDKISCKEFPDNPPNNTADFDETLWNMQKRVYDNIRIDLSTGATEYTKEDNATIFAKVTDLGLPINDGFCDVLIFDPNQTQIAGFSLDYVGNSRGIYSHVYPVPDDYGVYMVDVECFKPFNASQQARFFRTIDSTDKLLNTTSATTSYSETIYSVTIEIKCMDRRWTESITDKQNGNISDYRFLENITNAQGWFEDDTAASIDYEIYYKYYKVTDKGTVYMGMSMATATISNVITYVDNFADTGVEMPFDTTSSLQIEICFRRVSGLNPTDVTFWYNSNTYNSSVTINTLDYVQPLDFIVGGASEVHVSDIPFETYLEISTLPEPILVSNHDYCIDNNTLGRTLTWELCVRNRCELVTRNETIPCNYGCSNNMCLPSPWNTLIIAIIIAVVIIIVIWWFTKEGK